MAAEEEGSCCEEFGVMDQVRGVYMGLYRDLGKVMSWTSWIVMSL